MDSSILVVEHLTSAFACLGITDARVCFSGNRGKCFVPQSGAGIQSYVESLMPHVRDLGLPCSHARIKQKYVKEYPFKNYTAVMFVEPSDTLTITVDNNLTYLFQNTVGTKPLHLDDAYAQWERHAKARPVGRLQDPFVFAVWQTARLFGYKGITEDNYILLKPWISERVLKERMDEQYRDGLNEHCAHTAVCDFFGEAHALGNRVHGKFTLINSNHPTRVAFLKELVRENIVVAH